MEEIRITHQTPDETRKINHTSPQIALFEMKLRQASHKRDINFLRISSLTNLHSINRVTNRFADLTRFCDDLVSPRSFLISLAQSFFCLGSLNVHFSVKMS